MKKEVIQKLHTSFEDVTHELTVNTTEITHFNVKRNS